MLQVFRVFDPILSCSSKVPWNRVKLPRHGFKIVMGSTRWEKDIILDKNLKAKKTKKAGEIFIYQCPLTWG